MNATIKWIGAGLSGMALGTMTLNNALPEWEAMGGNTDLTYLTTSLLFPGLIFLLMGLFAGGTSNAEQKQTDILPKKPVISKTNPAERTVCYYRAVSSYKE